MHTMDLMQGRFLLAQLVVTSLATLFYIISYGGGVWWKITHQADKQYELSFTLWRLCSTYGDFDEQCYSISGDALESVILTTRACTSIGLILMISFLVAIILRVISLKKVSDDRWLKARSVLMVLLMLFMILSFSHSHHCPPVYAVGTFKMISNVGWGWNLYIATFIFLLLPFVSHCVQEVAIWRSTGGKI